MIFPISADETNNHSTDYHYLKRVLPLIFLFVILFFSAWVRFYGITEQGISGGDAFRYVNEAKRWVDGRTSFFAGGFYRPVSYFLQAAAIRIFGYNDYSIKLLHFFAAILRGQPRMYS